MLKPLSAIPALALCLAFAASSLGCKEKKPVLKPGELTQEQKDKLKQNALKAYGQIVKDYPDSPHAAEAKQRVEALSGPPQKK
jgi:hypothetical protein